MAKYSTTAPVKAQSFSKTLNLPKTEFPIRAQNSISDPELRLRWENENLFYLTFEHNKGNKKFILHDGPPYANGNIHLGHAYNKILKDIVCKVHRMAGFQVPVTPGWDCHGLPIELKVAQENPGLDKTDLKRACRDYAGHWVNVQRESFKSLGVLMDWARPYITMNFKYEATIVRAFGILVLNNFIERKNKTVSWCLHCETVLASAEIEYKNRKDPSIYTLFSLNSQDSKKLFNTDKEVDLLIWTTTPWTLPLNQAVLVNPKAEYDLLNINNKLVIVGSKVADELCKKLEVEKDVIETFSSEKLKGLKVKHPFLDKQVPLIFDDSVGLTEGTAFVHCAPGCGPVDYEIGVKNDLEIYSPVCASGKYTKDIVIKELENMPVTQGQIWVLRKLKELDKLLFKNNITHSYPHCWRCHNGLIFRATPQWFFDLNKDNIQDKALKAIDKINFIPKSGRKFLKATVENRWEWCLSRQRIWGVPIPALICTKCDHGFLNDEIIKKVADGIQMEGVEFWDKVEVKDLVSNKLTCPKCGTADVSNFKKETDILDVWFDAGVSHYAVLYDNPELAYPADMYLEGIDQHRGWFQSSLLTSLVLEYEPSMKAIMTHGFTVDSKGQKMSKSIGNVVSPDDIIKKLGTDGLRLWVASIGQDSDAVVSDALVQNISEVYRKVRNTCRFLLSNLYDFDIDKHAVSVKELLPADYYALTLLEEFNSKTIKNYFKSDFTAVFHGLAEFCTTELSSFYLDIAKDRLYVERADSHKRRSAQTAIWYILDALTKLMAPIMSFTSELISDYYQENKQENNQENKLDKKKSIHLQSFVDPKKLHDICYAQEKILPNSASYNSFSSDIKLDFKKDKKAEDITVKWELLRDIRSAILKSIEMEREKGNIKHPLEAHVTLYIDFSLDKWAPVRELLDSLELFGENSGINTVNFFKELLIVSQVTIADNKKDLLPTSLSGVYVKIDKAKGVKCPRCWNWTESYNPDQLCLRCEQALK